MLPRHKSSIIVRTSFEGLHYWQDAPEQVAFLRDPHRHIFHVVLRLEVFHNDRELEFILVRRALDSYIRNRLGPVPKPSKLSCEQMANEILDWCDAQYGRRSASCEVSEDGENGALVERDTLYPAVELDGEIRRKSP